MIWNPWRGCHRYSEGCKHCYLHKGDYKRNIDTNLITKSDDYDKPIRKNKSGKYVMKANSLVYVCFSSDFLLAEADIWRDECYMMMKERQNLSFLFLTKRIQRFMVSLPDDWHDGYDNVIVGVSVENQKNADLRLQYFKNLPIKHKNIICQPLLENINLEPYLEGIELVVVGGESDYYGRVLNYDWVLDIRNQCIRNNVSFIFRQCGSNFLKNGVLYKLPKKVLCSQARKAGIDYVAKLRS